MGDRGERSLTWWARAVIGVVFIIAALNWVGWASGVNTLTQIHSTWPHMPPWTALLLAVLGAAILVQSGRPSQARVNLGWGLAATAGIVAAIFILEFMLGRQFGLDELLFSEAVSARQSWLPGHPGPRTALSILLASVAVALTWQDIRWTSTVRELCLAFAAALPILAIASYFMGSPEVVTVTRSSGLSMPASVSMLLLVTATLLARPDRNPVAWLLARPDRRVLVRMAGLLTAIPITVGLLDVGLLTAGMRAESALVLSLTISTLVIGGFVLYFGQRELRKRIDSERLSSQRAAIERERTMIQAHYRLLADNAIDTVLHLRGTEIVWISPSVEESFGDTAEQWVGSDILQRIHPDDLDPVIAGLGEIAEGKSATARARLSTADGGYHWVEGRGKQYVDDEGKIDGVLAAFRIIDNQVEKERKLEHLVKFDELTGLTSRAETVARFDAALNNSRRPGLHLGVLFCDVDHFKNINDTWGHAVGDAVLSTLASRIRDCIRSGDTVGRIGGDEMLVLLHEMHQRRHPDRKEAAKQRCRTDPPQRQHHPGDAEHRGHLRSRR